MPADPSSDPPHLVLIAPREPVPPSSRELAIAKRLEEVPISRLGESERAYMLQWYRRELDGLLSTRSLEVKNARRVRWLEETLVQLANPNLDDPPVTRVSHEY